MRTVPCAALLAALALSAPAQLAFGPPQLLDGDADGARAVFLADLDGDGDLDVLSASEVDDTLAWHENLDSLGAFGPRQVITAALDAPASVRAADLDGDDDLDVFAVAELGDSLCWYANLDGQGSFGPAQVLTVSINQATSCRAADLDGDGDLDLLSTSEADHKLAWYENLDGQGGFGPEVVLMVMPARLQELCVVDLDGDGDLDVLTSGNNPDRVAWLEHLDGQGGFGPMHVLTNEPTNTQGCHVADLDGDGDPDVVVAGWSDGVLAWYANQGDGTFAPPQLLTVTHGATDVTAADLDEDGDLDLLCASVGTGVWWFENQDGLGGFGEARIVMPWIWPSWSLDVGDLDADQDLDVVMAFPSTDSVGWQANLLRPWHDLGHTFSWPGHDPTFSGAGPLVADLPVRLLLDDAVPGAPCTLVLGLTRIDLGPFKHGVLVPSPDIIVPFVPAAADGTLFVEVRWPPNVPADTTIYLQWWIPYDAAPAGYMASNGLSGTTPP